MTKLIKLDAPSVSFEPPETPLQPTAGDRPAPEADSQQQIDNALVAELESALQSVLGREPNRGAGQAGEPEGGAIAGEPESGETPIQAAIAGDSDPGEPARQPYLLRPAERPDSAREPSFPLETAPAAEPPITTAPRRRRLPLRAALCVGGVLALAGAGGAALVVTGPEAPEAPSEVASAPPQTASAAAPEAAADAEEPFVEPRAREVRTETIRVPAASAYGDTPSAAGGEANAAQAPSGSREPAGLAQAAAPADEVTLLRPVGGSRADGGAEPAAKTPDRLVEAPAPAAAASQDGGIGETPSGLTAPAAAADSAQVRDAGAEPSSGTSGRLADETSAAGGDMLAAVPTPLEPGELVARTAEGSDAGTAEATPAPEPQTRDEAALEAGNGETAAAGEATRAAEVTSAVNMRAGPDNGAAVLTVVPAGSEVELIGCEHWCQVVFDGERGWIYRSFVRGES